MKTPIHFYKYQGTGNDFVLIDNRTAGLKLTTSQIEQICDRRFGIGADGLILLENCQGYDFKMVYYNSDGNESSMCGNGGRCILRFAHDLGIVNKHARFMAIDGEHDGIIEAIVHLHMKDVSSIKHFDDHFELNTGSPHYVLFEQKIDDLDIVSIGRKIRYSEKFPQGINVNLVEQTGPAAITVRTYERGVEDETYSCGTGVVASVLSLYQSQKTTSNHISVSTKGGALEVLFQKGEQGFTQIFLNGPAMKVFEGTIQI